MKTQCNTNAIEFKGLKHRNIVADFKGGRITSDAGLLLVREVDRHLGLIDALDECIADPRDPSAIHHSQRDLIAQRIFAIAGGYEDLNDHDALRHDAALQTAVGREADSAHGALGSAPTLCRLENRVDRESMAKMAGVFVETFIASHDQPPQEILLDFDATDDVLHGQQEGRFFHGYYDNYCYLPLYVFCGEQLLVAYLRPSNIDGSRHSRPILKLLVERIRQDWPNTRIVIRGDSGFCRHKLMRWCERHDVGYIFGIARNAVLQRHAAPWTARAQHLFEQTGEKQRLFGETVYGAQTWNHPRRVILKAERLLEGPNLRFIVTNLPGDPQALYDGVYCQRGEMENRIKEQQLCLFADRTSCRTMLANQFRLLLASAAYVLVESLRRLGLAGTPLANARADTIRLKLFKIGARVVASVRRIVFHLAGGYPLQDLFSQIVRRLQGLASTHLPSG